jgi:hypothetical protein
MTHRVRADWSTDPTAAKTSAIPRMDRTDITPALNARRQTAHATEPRAKLSAE